MQLEKQMRAVIEGRLPGKGVLWLLSLLYKSALALRHKAYQSHFLPIKKVPAVVISIGNIAAGGVGKTPLVHFLANQLAERFSVAILSRGYRSRAEKQKEPVRALPSMDALEVGDEPLWLAQKLPQVQVWVGRDRVQSAEKAVQSGAEVVILDDGFQHRRLHRDMEVVVISGEDPLSSGYFLPRGYLRDFPSRLSSATLLAVMGPVGSDFKAQIKPFFEGPSVVFERKTTLALQGKKVALFCAIANPHRFIQQVKSTGAEVLSSLIKPDHDSFSLEEIEMLAEQSKAELLVCTEKDFVKVSTLQTSIPLCPVALELSIKEGHAVWKQLIEQIQSQVEHVRRISSYAS